MRAKSFNLKNALSMETLRTGNCLGKALFSFFFFFNFEATSKENLGFEETGFPRTMSYRGTYSIPCDFIDPDIELSHLGSAGRD